MGFGELAGKAARMLGNSEIAGGLRDGFDFGTMLSDLGVDPQMLAGLDLGQAKDLITEKGFDLSILDGLGLDLEALIAGVTDQA